MASMTRHGILTSMARTLFVTTFADACDGGDYPDFDPDGQEAGGGQDWFDTVTVTTPEVCVTKALEIAKEFEVDNQRTLEHACAEWCQLSGKGYDDFGHYLVMMVLGHGVGLWDDADEPASGFEVGYTCFDAGEWMS